MHTLSPSLLRALVASPAAEALSDAARERLGWIRYFVEHQSNISETCAELGIARSTFHRWLERFDPTDLQTLEEQSHMPHAMRTPLAPDHVITLIRAYRQSQPLMGKERIRELLQNDHNITVSASTIGRVIERECLYFAATPLHWKKRMEHEEAKQEISMPQTVTTQTQTLMQSATTPVFTKHSWKFWGRTIALSSVLVNIAFLSLYLATTSWESHTTTASVSQDLTQQTTTSVISSRLDQ